MHCRRVEKQHDVSVGEHADLPQVRSLHLDAVCCPHLTDRPMRPHAAGSCSSTAGITRTCALEKLDTREGAVAAQRAAALDPVSTAAACASMLSLQTLATGQECGSKHGSTLLTGAAGSGGHISRVRDARTQRSWVAAAMSPSANRVRTPVSGALRLTSVPSHFTTRTDAEARVWDSCGSPALLESAG